ncbi:hypothetical protein AB0M02_40215 [Actinoplanes sp. NPDC051861]|uniref:hypothetical protein n=1 Tax=Actinoplanes sp. NPDC051861 TaxID=3155170 RepID=UPI00342876D7
MSLAESPTEQAPQPTENAPAVGITITTVAAVLIAASVAARAAIAQRGYLSYDDFPMLSLAEANALVPNYLFGLFNNHLMPAGHAVNWLTLRFGGFDYAPFLGLLMAGQAAVSIALYRLLRLMLQPTWMLLVPLAVFLFSPLTLEASSWWAVGINMLPMQLAMVLAVGAQVKYIRTRRRKHLVTLALSVLLGLIFFEKALLTVALVFLMTLCLYAPGGPVRAVITTIRRWWPSWVTLTLISLLFLAGYLSRSTSSLRRPASVNEVVEFVAQMFTHTLIPGLLGGPWSWFPAGDGAPITAPAQPMRFAAIGVVLAFVAFTIWLRGAAAARAWLLVLLYTGLVAGLLGATRMGSVYSAVAGAVPRYIADVMVVAAIAIGAALCGLRREGVEEEKRAPRRLPAFTARFAQPALLGTLAVLLASATVSGLRFGDEWSLKAGRDYLANARADLVTMPAGTVFMDEPVPEEVVGSLSQPYNLQSKFFAPMENGPVFVTQSREVSVFDESGHIRPGWVSGVKAEPGPLSGCGYQLGYGKTTDIPLESEVPAYWHVVRIAYLADRDTSARLRIGIDKPVAFDVRRGLNAMFLIVWGSGSSVQVEIVDKAASVCSNELHVGELVPAPK